MKKDKGFTLIELLAIIIILSIIAVITVPIVLNVIDNAKKQSIVDSAYGYKDAISKYYMEKALTDADYDMDNRVYMVSELSDSVLNVNGVLPDSNSWVQIEDNDVNTGCLQFDIYKVYITNGNVGEAVKGEC